MIRYNLNQHHINILSAKESKCILIDITTIFFIRNCIKYFSTQYQIEKYVVGADLFSVNSLNNVHWSLDLIG